ncbi:unnamed protein product [Schistosoma mattheei]|uniref:Uncharacterized protein n=1 Tax=Schistosoma mattheei TaxID=31246 RepID=A0A3P8KV48_9TREM|nr:unnamed protein product [Schistosoma mattheei]
MEHQSISHLNIINNKYLHRNSIQGMNSNEQNIIHHLDTTTTTTTTILPLCNSRKSSKLYSFNENINNYELSLNEAQLLTEETSKKLNQIKYKMNSSHKIYCCCHGDNYHRKCRNNKINPEENLIHLTNRGEILENPNLIFNVS